MHPQLDLKITGGSGDKCVAELRAGLADLGMLTLPIDAPDLVSVPVVREELLLVTLAHIIFLAHLRSILIVTIPLPLAVLLAFLFMYYMGISSNLMSLSGIAIAIGVLVDAEIVVTENAFRFMETRKVDPKDRPLVWRTVLESTRLVATRLASSIEAPPA